MVIYNNYKLTHKFINYYFLKKPHKFVWDQKMKSFSILLSVFTEIHEPKLEK